MSVFVPEKDIKKFQFEGNADTFRMVGNVSSFKQPQLKGASNPEIRTDYNKNEEKLVTESVSEIEMVRKESEQTSMAHNIST